MKYKFDRKFFIPQGYELIAKDERFGFEVYAVMSPRIVAMAFGGKRQKPDWHFRFQDEQRLQAKISETLAGFMAHIERKAQWKAERSKPHDVKVGDVFRCSWGYDQTNVDFYEVTRVIGATVEIRAIAQEAVTTGWEQGQCVPVPGQYTGEAMRKKVNNYSGKPSLRIYSFASAYRMDPIAKVGDKPLYASTHWTAYA